MSCAVIRGDLLARIGLHVVLVGVVPLAGCHRASTPTRHAVNADRPIPTRGEQAAHHALPRLFPGVLVARTPTGGVSIRLLGAAVGGGPPLYVIDGAPVVTDPGRGFDWLKPEDVESITVLKRPAETAVYGPRGVNGVILVTTKQARTRRKGG